MRKKLATSLAVVALTVGAALPAAAAPPAGAGDGPADGRCVSNGVKALGGETISAVANGSVDVGLPVNQIILDHAFNNADVTESVLGVTICE